jgi:hypothetical protein
MSLEQAITDVTNRITAVSPDAVIRVLRQSDEEATIRAYTVADHEEAIKEATRDVTLELLTNEGLDVQVIFYDIATSLPPEEE